MCWLRSPERAMRGQSAFSLLEAMIVLLVMTIALSALAVPLAAQVQLRRHEETRRLLDEAKEALLGFAATHGRLPCPASEESRGMESFAAGGDASNGLCANFHGGYLPGAALALSPLDSEGFVRDAWMNPRNRIRYAVFGAGASVNGVAHPLTRANGMQAATLPALGAAPHYLFICSRGNPASASDCGPAANQLTRRAAFVLVSPGANAIATPSPGGDEARNLDGNGVFVSREFSSLPGDEFDDIVQWVAVHLVINRLILAGRLP
jgi:type II secretory pathway pseudopilin PulG